MSPPSKGEGVKNVDFPQGNVNEPGFALTVVGVQV